MFDAMDDDCSYYMGADGKCTACGHPAEPQGSAPELPARPKYASSMDWYDYAIAIEAQLQTACDLILNLSADLASTRLDAATEIEEHRAQLQAANDFSAQWKELYTDAARELQAAKAELARVEKERDRLNVHFNAGQECEKRDCVKALTALAGAHLVTPAETYGVNTSWAISDLCRGIAELSRQIAAVPACKPTAELLKTKFDPDHNRVDAMAMEVVGAHPAAEMGDAYRVVAMRLCSGNQEDK